MKDTPQIIRTVIDKEELVEFAANITVKKSGNGAHIIMPKQMIGKRVSVYYNKENKDE